MILTVRERLLLLAILPVQGDFTALKIIREMREGLSFSEEEHAILDFKVDSEKGMTLWKPEGDVPKNVYLGEKAMDIIKNSLIKLDQEKKLLMDHMELYEKFCMQTAN